MRAKPYLAAALLLVAMSAPARTAIHLAIEATVRQLDGCVNTFGLEHGRYPSQNEGLSLLVTGPPEKPETNSYAYIKAVPKDPWGRDYVYRFPSLHNPEGPDIYSLGEDGISKTGGNDADDINNWNSARPWAAYYNWRYQPFWYRHSNWLIGCAIVGAYALVFWCTRKTKPSEGLQRAGACEAGQ